MPNIRQRFQRNAASTFSKAESARQLCELNHTRANSISSLDSSNFPWSPVPTQDRPKVDLQ
jgi:hypothetical protein